MVKFTAVQIAQDPHEKSYVMNLKNDTNKLTKASWSMRFVNNAIENVNTAQNSAQAKAQSFSTGASDTSLEDVIVSLQKANLSLQGMIAVRNRLVDAYKEVTNLQV